MEEQITFVYTPSQIALACADIALTEMSSKGEVLGMDGMPADVDLMSYFPQLEMSVWDKVAEIKK